MAAAPTPTLTAASTLRDKAVLSPAVALSMLPAGHNADGSGIDTGDKNGTSNPENNNTDTAPAPQAWNESRTTVFRFCVALYSFAIMGVNDGAIGIELDYGVSYTVVSCVFLAAFVGYVAAALASNVVHHRLGQFGVAVLGPACRVVGYVALSRRPPFAALPLLLVLPGLGNGLEDSAWNAWIGAMAHANELLGVLHATYGLGAAVAPLVATALVVTDHHPWSTVYAVLAGLAGLGLLLAVAAFWGASGRVHAESVAAATAVTAVTAEPAASPPSFSSAPPARVTTRRVLREPMTWLPAIFLLGYVGVEVSLGGWIPSFMLDARHAGRFAAGMTATGFWLGLTVGRLVLGFVTGRIGEKRAIVLYLALAVILQLLSWLVRAPVPVAALLIALLGVVLGPLFPAAIVAATKLLPLDRHVPAIGFAAAFGSAGGAIFPFAVGAIAAARGVEALQPIVLAGLVFLLIVWTFLPGGYQPGGLERARDRHEPVGNDLRLTLRWLRTRYRSQTSATTSDKV